MADDIDKRRVFLERITANTITSKVKCQTVISTYSNTNSRPRSMTGQMNPTTTTPLTSQMLTFKASLSGNWALSTSNLSPRLAPSQNREFGTATLSAPQSTRPPPPPSSNPTSVAHAEGEAILARVTRV